MVKLNLACCDSLKEGYLNVDLNKDLPGVFPADARYLPFKDGSIEEIYASHFLEHLEIGDIKPCLLEWKRVLKKNGIIEVVVPDTKVIADRWLKATVLERITWWTPALFGSHRGPGQVHKCGLDAEILVSILLSCGLTLLSSRYNKEWDFWLEVRAKK